MNIRKDEWKAMIDAFLKTGKDHFREDEDGRKQFRISTGKDPWKNDDYTIEFVRVLKNRSLIFAKNGVEKVLMNFAVYRKDMDGCVEYVVVSTEHNFTLVITAAYRIDIAGVWIGILDHADPDACSKSVLKYDGCCSILYKSSDDTLEFIRRFDEIVLP